MQRFWSKVDIRGPDDCWDWTAGQQGSGYGTFGRGTRQEGKELAHRMAWELTNGPIPKGMCICHHCDNKLCCNPEHLFLGSYKENTADMIQKGRQPKGEDHRNAKLKNSDIPRIRELLRRGTPPREIAAEYQVARRTISCINTGATWRHIK